MWKRTGLVLFLCVALSGQVYAKINVFTADNVVQLVKDRITKIKTFSGSFVYVYNNKTSWGSIQYKSPNKFIMRYMNKNAAGQSYETGQKFISDGKNLWLYFKDQNIAISETLEKDKSPMIGWNINRLLKEYVARLPEIKKATKASDYLVTFGKQQAYKLIFVPKSNTAGFKYINMIVSQTGEILKVETQNQLGVNLDLMVVYENFNSPIAETTFQFEADENTQIYENILLPDQGENE